MVDFIICVSMIDTSRDAIELLIHSNEIGQQLKGT